MAAMLAATLADPALAAGGAHIVDDAEVETPGVCHLDLWATRLSGNTGVLVAAPACTPKRLPNLEIGGSLVHTYPGRVRDFSVGPSLKWELRPPSRGLGIAVEGYATWSSRTSRVESAGLIVPFSVDATNWLRLNANVGYLWTRTGDVRSAFLGGQALVQMTPRLGVMGEVFYRDPGSKVGVQSGVRWTPRPWLDIDLLGAHRVDGSTPDAFTLGITIRH